VYIRNLFQQLKLRITGDQRCRALLSQGGGECIGIGDGMLCFDVSLRVS